MNNYEEDRYKITVELTLTAESIDEAQEVVQDIVQQGIIGLMDNEELSVAPEWDITEAEPAEVL